MVFTMASMAFRTPPAPSGHVTIMEAAKRLNITRAYLYGVLLGMDLKLKIEPTRVDGSRRPCRPRKLLTDAQFAEINRRLQNSK